MRLLMLSMLLSLAGCDTVGPSGPPPGARSVAGSVALQLSGNLQLLQDEQLSLVISVHQDVAAEMGPKEGTEQTFAMDSTDFVVRDIKLGWKWFSVQVIDPSERVWGQGKVRHLVRPGLQILNAPLTIKVQEPATPIVAASMSFHVGIHQPGQTPKITFVDIQPLFDKHHCLNCHFTEASHELGHGLDLTVFPFTSTNDRLPDFPTIADEVARSVVAFSFPMPPSPYPRLPDADARLIEDWTFDGYLQFPAGADQTSDLATQIHVTLWDAAGEVVEEFVLDREDATQPFVWTLPRLPVGENFRWRARVMAADGEEVFRQEEDVTIPAGGVLPDAALSIPYQAGEVTLPIVIEE